MSITNCDLYCPLAYRLDAAKSELDRARVSRDAAKAELNATRLERDAAWAKYDRARADLKIAQAFAEDFRAHALKQGTELEALKRELAAVKAERDERDAGTQRDDVRAELAAALSQRDAARRERNRAEAGRESARRERDEARAELDILKPQLRAFEAELAAALSQRDDARRERDDARADLASARAATKAEPRWALRDAQRAALAVAPDPGPGLRWGANDGTLDINLYNDDAGTYAAWIELSSWGWQPVLASAPGLDTQAVKLAEVNRDPRVAMQAVLDALAEGSR